MISMIGSINSMVPFAKPMYTTHVPWLNHSKRWITINVSRFWGDASKTKTPKRNMLIANPSDPCKMFRCKIKMVDDLWCCSFWGDMDMDISKYQTVLHCFLDHNSQHSKGKLLIYRGHYIPSPNNALFLPYICIAWSHQKWVMTHDPWFTAPSCWICTSWIGSPNFSCNLVPFKANRIGSMCTAMGSSKATWTDEMATLW